MTYEPAHELLSCLPISDVAKLDLMHRMSEPSRHYHTLLHLQSLWRRHEEHRRVTSSPEARYHILIAAAIAFHDAVYVSGARDNESRSADLWLEVSATASRFDEPERRWVAESIRATADHVAAAAALDLSQPEAYARQWLLDLDLTPLGEAPDVFDANMILLAAEMSHIETADQRRAILLAGLRHFATAHRLYRCAAIAWTFERAAEANLHRHLS